MRQFPTGVTIVTSAHEGRLRGMTANSVASVSFAPISLLVCVNREAVMHGILSRAGTFCVNILSEHQEALARACARPDSAEAALEGIGHRLGTTGAPILDDALAYVECEVSASLDFGTHTIFVGEAVNLDAVEGRPLLFYDGKFTGFDNRPDA